MILLILLVISATGYEMRLYIHKQIFEVAETIFG